MPRRTVTKQEEVSVADLFSALSKQLTQQSRKPNILGYEPHEKQLFFHKFNEHLRLYIGGNRSGKSYGAVAEDIWWASGTHPYIDIKGKWPGEQIRGRVIGVDFDRGVKEILVPLFQSLCPLSYLRGESWDKAWEARGNGGLLHFKYEKSYIEFLSYEQSTEKFAGTSRHFIHYDEEPPKNIFTESQARLVDTAGSAWISMTPVEGMTWVYDDMYQKAEESEDKEYLLEGDGDIGPVWIGSINPYQKLAVVEVGMNENPHLTKAAREQYLAGLDLDERAARSKGHFVQTAGKVFKSFAVETHVTTEDISPKSLQHQGWQIYSSVDHGWNAPTAWLWHAVAPQGEERVLTFGEHYASEMTIEEHAAIVAAKEEEWGLKRDDIIRTGDPAMHQHSGITGGTIVTEYAKYGLYIYTDSIPKDRNIGIARMQQYFRIRTGRVIDETGVVIPNRPTWMISSDCPNMIKELRNLRWKAYASKKIRDQNNPQEQVHKLHDHAFDSAKYFATFLPDLAPDPPVVVMPDGRSATMTYDEALRLSLARAVDTGPEWTIVETYN